MPLPKRLPDFFIVGAPKSGTSAMGDYLEQHPDIYLPPWEPQFFGSDLRYARAPRTLADYRAFFAKAKEPILGDKSVSYLYSRLAAREIHGLCPEARIIIMLRNPVDMMYSWHGEALWSHNEDLVDFAEALAAESDRAAGRRLPSTPGWLDATSYRALARYRSQVERYLDTFGVENVHIIVFEEFVQELEGAFRDVLRFLGAEESFTPEFRLVNPAKILKSRPAGKAGALAVRRLAPRLGLHALPRRLRWRLGSVLRATTRMNTRASERDPMDSGLRSLLLDEFAPETDALEALIGRDLSVWRR